MLVDFDDDDDDDFIVKPKQVNNKGISNEEELDKYEFGDLTKKKENDDDFYTRNQISDNKSNLSKTEDQKSLATSG